MLTDATARSMNDVERLIATDQISEEAATNPLAQAPANWPERHTGRGTIPESSASWKRFHGEPDS